MSVSYKAQRKCRKLSEVIEMDDKDDLLDECAADQCDCGCVLITDVDVETGCCPACR